MLEEIAAGNKDVLDKSSLVVRASLKLDAYSYDKVHGDVCDLSTRLIYSSCYVQNSVMRALMAKVASSCIQAGLYNELVKRSEPMDSKRIAVTCHCELPTGLTGGAFIPTLFAKPQFKVRLFNPS